jgi:hypothetical protein
MSARLKGVLQHQIGGVPRAILSPCVTWWCATRLHLANWVGILVFETTGLHLVCAFDMLPSNVLVLWRACDAVYLASLYFLLSKMVWPNPHVSSDRQTRFFWSGEASWKMRCKKNLHSIYANILSEGVEEKAKHCFFSCYLFCICACSSSLSPPLNCLSQCNLLLVIFFSLHHLSLKLKSTWW